MAEQTPAEIAQKELDVINEEKVQAQAELDGIDASIEDANAELDEANELTAKERKKLEKDANTPSVDKYKDMAKAMKKKGANKKPLIRKGRGYEITLNK